jgi:DNA-binding Lrp family transcriptional regulator
MTRLERYNVKVRILRLASLECTGPPVDLASMFGISERSVKRIVREIRNEGKSIRYCHFKRSYVIDKDL